MENPITNPPAQAPAWMKGTGWIFGVLLFGSVTLFAILQPLAMEWVKNETDELEKKVASLDSRLLQMSETVVDMSGTQGVLTKRIHELQAERDAAQKEIDKLQADLANSTIRYDALLAELAAKEQRIKDLETAIFKLKDGSTQSFDQ